MEMIRLIGKAEWFDYKIAGWGIRPKTKQGWLYCLVVVLIAIIISIIPTKNIIKTSFLFILIILVVIDAIHIMFQLSRVQDEREQYHQLIIERGASIAGVTAIFVIFLHDFLLQNKTNYSLLYVLLIMSFMKLIMFIYVKRKM